LLAGGFFVDAERGMVGWRLNSAGGVGERIAALATAAIICVCPVSPPESQRFPTLGHGNNPIRTIRVLKLSKVEKNMTIKVQRPNDESACQEERKIRRCYKNVINCTSWYCYILARLGPYTKLELKSQAAQSHY
jgi:hypothetical protein